MRHWGKLGKTHFCVLLLAQVTLMQEPSLAPCVQPALGTHQHRRRKNELSPWASGGGKNLLGSWVLGLAKAERGNLEDCSRRRAALSFLSCMPFPRLDSIIIALPNKRDEYVFDHCIALNRSVCSVCGVCLQHCHSINQEDCFVFPPQPGSVSSGRNQLRCSFSFSSLLPCPVSSCCCSPSR